MAWSHESRHKRGYGTKWSTKIRPAILKRDRGLCQMCKAEGKITPGNEVDHIIPKSQGGTDHPSNLAVICRQHHAVKTQAESQGRDFMHKGCNSSGVPNDPDHHWN